MVTTKMNPENSIVMGIDPGFDRFGISVVRRVKGKDVVLYSNCIQTDKKLTFEQRLVLVIDEFEKILTEHKPDLICMEAVFMHNNAKSVINVAEIKGAVKLIVSRKNIRIIEMTPQKIKLAVAGSGAAKKDEVIKMVKMITKHISNTGLDDEYDAIACGLAGLAYCKTI